MILSPYTKRVVQVKPKPPEPNVFDISVIINLKNELDTEIQKVKDLGVKMQQEHEAKLLEVDEKLVDHTMTVSKLVNDKLVEVDDTLGELKQVDFTGLPGSDAVPVDEEAMAERVFSRIRTPKDGDTPIIDTLEIAKAAAKFVKVKIPEPKKIEINHDDIADKVVGIIVEKKKLKVEHITDLFGKVTDHASTMFNRFVARGSLRGGGDVVTAGSNVTITTNADGKKVIASTGGSGGNFTENEVVAGSGTAFTLAATPTAGSVKLYALGQRIVLATDYSIVGTAITTVSSWSAGQIVADYRTP